MPNRSGETLAGVIDEITQKMEATSQLRDGTLSRSRRLIRDCAHSIRAMHRHELGRAEEMLAAIRRDAREMVGPLADFPELYHAGYTQDALKELVEAHLLYALYHRWSIGDAGRAGGDRGDLPEGADRGGDGDAPLRAGT